MTAAIRVTGRGHARRSARDVPPGALAAAAFGPQAVARAVLPEPGEPPAGVVPVSHNLHGQRLGRKGRDTRERILAATAELVEGECEEQLSLSAVARRASIKLTSVYNYFSDLTELLLALLEPVMATAEDAYLSLLRERWTDDQLAERCEDFVHAYQQFWARHSRLLHLRNSMADMLDQRMMMHRVESTQPIIGLLVAQMDADVTDIHAPAYGMATMVMIGIERSVTIVTDRRLHNLLGWNQQDDEERYILPGSRLMQLAVRDMRAANRG